MNDRRLRLGVDLFTGAVVVSVAIALAGLCWRLAGDPGRRLGAAPVAARAGRPVDIAPLVALAPFGSGAPAATQAADQSLVLRGILLAVPRSASSALVSVGGAAPIAVFAGQALGPGTIESIERDHLVINAGGVRQLLAFPERPGGGAPASTPTPSGAPPPGPIVLAAPGPALPPPTGDPGQIMGALGASPTQGGYRVGDGLSPAFRQSGLQPGDVIERINGTPVGDAGRDRTLMAQAMASGVARIDVIRAGQRLTLSISLR